ncbi:MAG: aminopeptidase P family protein [Alkalinema sp. RU_4_3]|nr:aminopeptidase P family protein [Alkalinema sp. RU_4_3]
MTIELLRQRRRNLGQFVKSPVLLWSGGRSPRNFRANPYPYRASSHFLYFVGRAIENAVVALAGDRLTLFWDEPPKSAALWHGETLSREALAAEIGAEAAHPMAALGDLKWLPEVGTVALTSGSAQVEMLGRELGNEADRALAEAIVQVRLRQDAGAIEQIQQAVGVTIEAHRAGMTATREAKTEAMVRAAMEQVLMANGMTTAYNSIVTVHGEVLHNEDYHHRIAPGDLLLADVGAETPLGWAADVTRTWPVSGQFSPTQRDLYEVVLAANQGAIAAVRPGMEYRDVHLLACRILAEGLVSLGILRGNPEDLVAQDAHALFFPHGIGHLLGLDVHDMEDLGDVAGYAAGRSHSDRFGLGYLRLDRPLVAGMVVTIEPGFYQVPAILGDRERRDKFVDLVDWDRLGQFSDCRGIRIEDDLLVMEQGAVVLTGDLEKEARAIETRLGA